MAANNNEKSLPLTLNSKLINDSQNSKIIFMFQYLDKTRLNICVDTKKFEINYIELFICECCFI